MKQDCKEKRDTCCCTTAAGSHRTEPEEKLLNDSPFTPDHGDRDAGKFSFLDHPDFSVARCAPAGDAIMSTEFYLEGVHCTSCVPSIESLPKLLQGVVDARLDFAKSLLRIAWDTNVIRLSEIASKLDMLGYTPHAVHNHDARELYTQENRKLLLRIGVAGALAGNTMLLAIALYAGAYSGIEARFENLFRWISLVLGWISLMWPGRSFLLGAITAIRTRTPHMDLPIAIGLVAGMAAGTIHTIFQSGDVYFDSLTVLIFMLLIGRWTQFRQQRKTKDAIELLFSLTPACCRLVENQDIRVIPIESLNSGDCIEILAGDSVPADAAVVFGQSEVDESLLTGESRPRRIDVGDEVCAGSVNLASSVRCRVHATGSDTRVGKLMKVVEACTKQKAPFVQFADRIAGKFTVTIMFMAVLTFLFWSYTDLNQATTNAVALLIVACPCALGLATPLALAVAIGRAARRHILIKGGGALEQMAKPGMIYLDKTGTLTVGNIRLMQWEGSDDVKAVVAAVEAQSGHSIARAFAHAFSDLQTGQAEQVEQHAEGGITGIVGDHQIAIGSPRFLSNRNFALPSWVSRNVDRYTAQCLTPVLIAVDGKIEATAGLGDPIRDDAVAALASLRRAGWQLEILSGDHIDVVRRVATQVGIDPAMAQGGLTPEQKMRIVTERCGKHTVVMVGDGSNDAAALAAATVGIAVHGGAEASLAAADVYIGQAGLAPIVDLIVGARRTVTTIRRNLLVSFGYNATAICLAATGIITPLIAAVLMPFSSFTVLTLSIGAQTFAKPVR